MTVFLTGILAAIRDASILRGEITIPVHEAVMLLGLLSLCLLLRFSRIGLTVAYLFTYRWGWLFCTRMTSKPSADWSEYEVVYLVFGAGVLILSLLSFTLAWHKKA